MKISIIPDKELIVNNFGKKLWNFHLPSNFWDEVLFHPIEHIKDASLEIVMTPYGEV